MAVNRLQIECSKCRVAGTCPRKGSSPLAIPRSGQRRIYCQLVGGYGRAPVPKHMLSADSQRLAERDGPCLTLVEIPVIDELTGEVGYVLTKVFSKPILHERETVGFHMGMLYPKSGGER